MIKIGPNYNKLKISLQLAITRLKCLQSKKFELSEKEMFEVSKYLQNGKYMQARIKAQRIIRDEATIEAMELIEIYCEQLLERYDLFQLRRQPDDWLTITVSNLIWVAPHYQTLIKELKVVMKQLSVKYGNNFCRNALTNQSGNVNPELIERVRLFMPTDEKIEICLKNICRKYNVKYKEDKMYSIGKQKDFNLCSQENKLNENSEFQTRGSQEIDNSISSKKAFAEIMSKFKIKKSKKKKKDEDKETYINPNPTSTLKMPIGEKNSSDKGVLGSGEQETDLDVRGWSISDQPTSKIRESQKNYFDSSKNENKSDENPISSTASPMFNGEYNFKYTEPQPSSEIGESQKYTLDSSKNDHNTIFSSAPPMFNSNYNVIYTEPPPPYNYLYTDGKNNKVKGQTCEYLNFQYPSCPSYPEIPDFSPENIEDKYSKRKSEKKESNKNEEALCIDAISSTTLETSIDEKNTLSKTVSGSREQISDSVIRSDSFHGKPSSDIGESEKNTFDSSKNEISDDQKAVFSSAAPILSSNYNLTYTESPPSCNSHSTDSINNEAEEQTYDVLNTAESASYPELTDIPPENFDDKYSKKKSEKNESYENEKASSIEAISSSALETSVDEKLMMPLADENSSNKKVSESEEKLSNSDVITENFSDKCSKNGESVTNASDSSKIGTNNN